MERELFASNETYPILEIKDADCFHVAVEHFIKRSITSVNINEGILVSLAKRRFHLRLPVTFIKNDFASYDTSRDIGQSFFPAGSFNIDSVSGPLKDKMLFTLGDCLEDLTIETERSREWGAKSSRITMTKTTGNRQESDHLTIRVDAQTFNLTSRVNGQTIRLEQNNLDRCLALSTELVSFTNTRLSAHLRTIATS